LNRAAFYKHYYTIFFTRLLRTICFHVYAARCAAPVPAPVCLVNLFSFFLLVSTKHIFLPAAALDVPGCGDERRGSTVCFFLAGGSPSCALWRGVASSLLAGFWPLAFASSSDSLCVSLNLQQVDINDFFTLPFRYFGVFYLHFP
jgi:hypothetical protein